MPREPWPTSEDIAPTYDRFACTAMLRIHYMYKMADTGPLIPHEERPDDDDGNTTGPFVPHCSSTPRSSGEGFQMTTMNRPPERGRQVQEISFIGNTQGRRIITTENQNTSAAQSRLVDSEDVKGLNTPKIVAIGPKNGETMIFNEHMSVRKICQSLLQKLSVQQEKSV